jgi:lipopolysaccharide/colanic/teichoic acid biosynthesis glycosyltransferase/GT2 family glycosyltransferase
MKPSSVSVIVPAYNAERSLPDCLRALARQTRPPDEIIVVDDGSTDDTAGVACRHGARLIRQANAGPAVARNAGVAAARGDLVLFTDADCAPWPDWIERMCRPFDDPGVAGAKGAYRTRQRSLVARFVQQEYAAKYRRTARYRSIDFVDTYAAAYRRDIFLRNGGFNAGFTRAAMEDHEFSSRLARKGHRLVFLPDAIVDHRHTTSVSGYFRRKYGVGYWKAVMLRHLPEKALTDSHTLPSQRWQIALLGLALLSLAAGAVIGMPGVWLAAACLALFGLTALPFLAAIWKHDRPVLLVAPLLLAARAAALGAGLGAGFASPHPAAHPGEGLSLAQRPVKRAIDIGLSAVGLAAGLPVMLAAAAAIKLETPGPALFVQERAGEGGRPFKIYKLRTMVDGAEERLPELLSANSVSGPTFKMPNDPRVTRVGRVLRRWSIDELPQLWNVLRGEMSLVGPRPEPLRYVAQYDERQRLRLIVKPGLTGPAQVAGRGQLDFEQRLILELEYIQHYSLRKDISIICRTIGTVLSGLGAF